MAFYHWNAHNQKSYISTIQKAILSIYLCNLVFYIRDALTTTLYNITIIYIEIYLPHSLKESLEKQEWKKPCI